MFDVNKEWSISFAGCGFMGIYYVGATSCILERFPRFIQDACKIYGSSAGSLMAATLILGIPLDECCADLMLMAREARKHRLGPLHPAFNLLKLVHESLQRSLPEDAHVRASGRLCVSLTRVPDGKNVLVSEFESREELIEALICSCFVPFYCGVIPPTYRGVHYVDGAVSDNLPRCHLKNTVTFSGYAGESDICPPTTTLNFHEVRFNNVSIQVSSENMYRVTSTFFPPDPEAMSEICQSGYMDALRFLQENNLISSESPMRSLETDSPTLPCCDLLKKKKQDEAEESDEKENHVWLNPQLVDNLPLSIRKVLCKACKESHTTGGLFSNMAVYLPKNVTSYLQIPRPRPVESAYSLAQRLVNWIPDVSKDMSWLYAAGEDVYKQSWKDGAEDDDGESPLRRCTSLPLDLNTCETTKLDIDALPLTPEATPTSNFTFTWKTPTRKVDHMPLTPPPTPSFSPTSEFEESVTDSPQSTSRGGVWGLGRAVGWIRNIAFEQNSKHMKMDD